MRKFIKGREMGLVILLLILMAGITANNPAFIRPDNILNISGQPLVDIPPKTVMRVGGRHLTSSLHPVQ